MYRPPAFREDRPEVLRDAIHRHPLATLVTYGTDGLQANLLPFIIAAGAGGGDVLRGHLAKANGQLRDLASGLEALVIFQGPEAYISPSWYATKRQHGRVVPTWNYVVVQARGSAKLIDDPAWLLAHVQELTGEHERGRKKPWAVTDAPVSFVSSMLKGIVGIEISISHIEGKWKVSQNQPAENRDGVVEGLRAHDPKSMMAAIVSKER